jgi:hypothetical protein
MSEASVLKSPAVRPGHAPESLVYDFDFFHGPGLQVDPRAGNVHGVGTLPLLWNA